MNTIRCPSCTNGTYRTDDARYLRCTNCNGTGHIKAGIPQPDEYMHRDSSHGYTTSPMLAMKGEQAVVPRTELEAMAEANHKRHAALKASLPQAPLHERIRQLETAGSLRRDDLAAIERRIQAVERRTAA